MKKIRWSPDELKAVGSTQPFLIKARVIKKVWTVFDDLREALMGEVKGASFLAPESLDLKKGQIAKGERFQELPFVFMDYPQLFLPGQACTFRAFFWWGHGVSFALILQGDYMDQYKNRILDRYAHWVGKQLHLSTAPTPWEWRIGHPYSVEIKGSSPQRVRRTLDRNEFIKLFRFFSLRSQAFRLNHLVHEGLQTFRLLRPIISR